MCVTKAGLAYGGMSALELSLNGGGTLFGHVATSFPVSSQAITPTLRLYLCNTGRQGVLPLPQADHRRGQAPHVHRQLFREGQHTRPHRRAEVSGETVNRRRWPLSLCSRLSQTHHSTCLVEVTNPPPPCLRSLTRAALASPSLLLWPPQDPGADFRGGWRRAYRCGVHGRAPGLHRRRRAHLLPTPTAGEARGVCGS